MGSGDVSVLAETWFDVFFVTKVQYTGTADSVLLFRGCSRELENAAIFSRKFACTQDLFHGPLVSYA
jgi:hypothetical protein